MKSSTAYTLRDHAVDLYKLKLSGANSEGLAVSISLPASFAEPEPHSNYTAIGLQLHL